MLPQDLVSDSHHLISVFFSSLEIDAFPTRAQRLCCGEHRPARTLNLKLMQGRNSWKGMVLIKSPILHRLKQNH